jgi:hypothetical protein
VLPLIDAIDFPHDPLRPLNSRSNQGFRPRTWLGIKEILGRLQMTCHEDSSHNREHSFATLVHAGIVSYSLFIRQSRIGLQVKIRGRDIVSIPDRVVERQESTGPTELCSRRGQA